MAISAFYKNLAQKGAFRFNEACSMLSSREVASIYLYRLMKKGLIRRVRKNLYVIIDLASGCDAVDKNVIATHISESSFVSYHSAFEFYGFYNQVRNDVQVSSSTPFQEFNDKGILYRSFKTSNLCQIERVKGVMVSTIERTIIDSINKLGVSMDTGELLECLELVPFCEEEKLEEMLVAYDKDVLYRKSGYILSYFKESLGLSNGFFDFCKKHSNRGNSGRLVPKEEPDLKYVKEWGLYGYRDILRLISEIEDIDV
jgi:predicted transcriptional regulator of viral defense system